MRMGPYTVTDIPVDDEDIRVDAEGLECECGQRVFLVFASKQTLYAKCVVCGMTFVIQ